MLEKILSLGFFIVTLLTANASFATDYYVDPSGNDANDGTSTATAWQTLAKVSATTFQPGDRILFKTGGVWNGQLSLQGSGTNIAPITLDMYGTGSKPIINGPGTDNSSAIQVVDYSYWTIQNFEVTNQPTVANVRLWGILASAQNSASITNINILNCYVHDVYSFTTETNANFNKITGGIILTGLTHNVLVKGCTVKNVSVEGIRNNVSSGYSNSVVIDSNYLENIYGDGIVFHGAANGSKIIRNVGKNLCYNTGSANYAGMWTYVSKGTLIAYNEVYDTHGGGVNDGQAFDADEGVDGDIFEYNYSHDNKKGFMLFMPSAKNVIVRYNLSIRDNGVANNYQRRRLINYTSSSSTNYFYNNVFYIDTTVDYFFETGFLGKFTNNIIYSTKTMGKFSEAAIGSSAWFYNNCFYPSSIISTNGPNGNIYGNITSDPMFSDPTGNTPFGRLNGIQNKFSLQTNSPCVTNGTYVPDNGNLDYVGNSLNNKTFIGAILPPNAPEANSYTYQVTERYTPILGAAVTTQDAFGDGLNTSDTTGSRPGMFVKAGGTNTIGTIRKGFLRFPTTGILTDTLNKNTDLKAVIRLRAFGKESQATTLGVAAWTIPNNTQWNEHTLTSNNMPTLNTQIGAVANTGSAISNTLASSPKLSSQVANIAWGNNGEYIDIDITAFIKNYLTTNSSLPSYFDFALQSYCTVASGTEIGNSGVYLLTKEIGVDSLSPRLMTVGPSKDTTYTVVVPIDEATTPVQASPLVATAKGSTVQLSWKTYSETNAAKFIVEHSTDGKNFTPLDSIAAHGYSQQIISYNYLDKKPFNGWNFYRYKEMDFDGQYQYSNIAKANIMARNAAIISIAPNPVASGSDFTIQFNSSQTQYITIRIVDMQGIVFKTMSATLQTGIQTLSVPTVGLTHGIYNVQIQGSYNRQSQKIVIL